MALGELKNGIGPDAYAIYQQVLAAVVERDHPVGSLYISENATSPAELYGGTWEQIKDRFIMAAGDIYAAGSTGGEAEHSHEYAITYIANYSGIVGGSSDYSVMAYNGTTGGNNMAANNAGTGVGNQYSAVSTTPNQTIYYKRSLGKTGYGTNIPPYTAKYVWQRIE